MRRIAAFFLLSVLVAACAPATEQAAVKASISDFTRLEARYGGFTKHFRESVFKITREGRYSVEALLPGRTLHAGRNDFDFILHDRQDRDVSGALVTAAAVKPETGLKAEAAGVAEGGTAGLYAVEKLLVPAPGHWQLVFTIMGSGGADTVTFDFSMVPERPEGLTRADHR